MKNKRKNILRVLFFILIIIAIIAFCNQTSHITLTQLSAQGARQMMGYLLKTDKGKVIVIDGGTIDDTNNLIKKINENGGKVDYWFLTHAHDDHVGAFTEIVNKAEIPIENIYVSVNELEWYKENEETRIEFIEMFLDTLKSDKIKDKVKEPKINEKIEIDNIEVEILGVKNPEITINAGNEQSMVFTLKTEKTKILILGDTGEKSSEKLLSTQKEKLKSDILQIAHHGQQGATKQLYETVGAKIWLWPTPEWLWNNDSGDGVNTGPWKTFETREWMKELKVNKNYISKDGDITIEIR